MNYLPKNISEKLHKLGCVSESGFCYAYWDSPEGSSEDLEIFPVKEVSGDLIGVCPAFIFQDLLNPENAKKIWGEGFMHGSSQIDHEGDCAEIKWQYYRHKLIDLYPDGDWLGVVKEFIN